MAVTKALSLNEVLFRLLVLDDAPDGAAESHRRLSQFTPRRLAQGIEALEPHKVFPLLAHRLAQTGTSELLPSELGAELQRSFTEARRLNGMLMLSLANILRAASALEVQPVLLKGALFADSYYPDVATRPMGDIDLLAAPNQAARLYEALARAGFSRSPTHVVQAHAVAFENTQGVACDAHAYLEMYPYASWSELAEQVTLRRLRGVKACALKPNVMLAHLIEHMHGHLPELGVAMLWLLDIVFVLRRHRAEITAAGLRPYLVEPGAFALFLRVLGLLLKLGETLPEGLQELAPQIARVPALTLEETLRLRRTRPWGLPRPIGFARLVARRVGLRDYPWRALPTASDLLCLPLDAYRARKIT